jgi:hypothetical protein
VITEEGSERIKDGWMDGWVDGWMHGWMDGWMDGLNYNGRERQHEDEILRSRGISIKKVGRLKQRELK